MFAPEKCTKDKEILRKHGDHFLDGCLFLLVKTDSGERSGTFFFVL